VHIASGFFWGRSHAYVWQNGQFKDLGTNSGNASYPYGLNGKGQVVGVEDVDKGGHYKPVL